MAWPTNRDRFGPDRIPVLTGLSDSDEETTVPIAVDPTSGEVQVAATITVSSAELPSALINNQQTVTTSAVALPSGALTQGVILEALSTNSVSIFVGGSGVSDSTGYELQPGASVGIAINNTAAIYVICASTSPVVSWIGS